MTTPPSHHQASQSLLEFLRIIAKLRDPNGGCPWDLKQTFETLRALLVDEAYEVMDAVEAGPEAIREELGDLLSLVALYAQIGEEQGMFTFSSILDGISSKLVRRHPHVFGDVKVSGTEEVLKNWEAIKAQERAAEPEKKKGLLDGLPRSMPSLAKSHEIGVRCQRVGFDWGTTDEVAEKVKEELTEFLNELPSAKDPTVNKVGKPFNQELVTEEFGDLLFSLVQESRHLGFSAEEALRAANNKFLARFKIVEQLVATQFPNRSFESLSMAELEALWQEAKKSASRP